MALIKPRLTMVRTLGVAILASATLAACVTRDDITAVTTRLDMIDARVQSVAQSAEAANQSAQRANQRIDAMEGRIQRLEAQAQGMQSSSNAPPPERAPGV